MKQLPKNNSLSTTRRQLFSRTATGIGVAALASLFEREGYAAPGLAGFPNFPPTAKRVIYLHQSGGPSQLDLFDYKPELKKQSGIDLPATVRNGQRITGMTSGQSSFPVTPSLFTFKQYGQSGAWVSELLPHTAKIVDFGLAIFAEDELPADKADFAEKNRAYFQ